MPFRIVHLGVLPSKPCSVLIRTSHIGYWAGGIVNERLDSFTGLDHFGGFELKELTFGRSETHQLLELLHLQFFSVAESAFQFVQSCNLGRQTSPLFLLTGGHDAAECQLWEPFAAELVSLFWRHGSLQRGIEKEKLMKNQRSCHREVQRIRKPTQRKIHTTVGLLQDFSGASDSFRTKHNGQLLRQNTTAFVNDRKIFKCKGRRLLRKVGGPNYVVCIPQFFDALLCRIEFTQS
mmetsp:Transcript_4834/g.10870  ORF Transcript_4834/g.10870 Transcript_4834/m.10870 type:complete len:235 (+) Transcript_4834:1577-2281(+)